MDYNNFIKDCGIEHENEYETTTQYDKIRHDMKIRIQ